MHSQWRDFSEYLELLRGGFLCWRTLIGGPHLRHVYSSWLVQTLLWKGPKDTYKNWTKEFPGLCDLSELKTFVVTQLLWLFISVYTAEHEQHEQEAAYPSQGVCFKQIASVSVELGSLASTLKHLFYDFASVSAILVKKESPKKFCSVNGALFAEPVWTAVKSSSSMGLVFYGWRTLSQM